MISSLAATVSVMTADMVLKDAQSRMGVQQGTEGSATPASPARRRKNPRVKPG